MKRVLLMSLALVSTATFAQEETPFSQNLKAAFDTSQELNDNIAKTSFTLPVLNPNNCILGSPDSTETTGYCPVPVAAESLVKSIKYVDIGEYDVTVFNILTEAQLYTSGVTGDGTQSVELSQKLDVTAVTQNTFKLFCRNDFNIKTDCGGDVTIFGKLNEATKSFKQTVLDSSLTQVEMAIDGQISNATSTIDQQISKVESLANNALNSAGNNTSALGSLELLVGSNTAGVTSAQADANTALASANSANATASQNSSDIASLTTVVDKKANLSDLSGKANTVDVDAKLAKKADINYVDGEIAKLPVNQPVNGKCAINEKMVGIDENGIVCEAEYYVKGYVHNGYSMSTKNFNTKNTTAHNHAIQLYFEEPIPLDKVSNIQVTVLTGTSFRGTWSVYITKVQPTYIEVVLRSNYGIATDTPFYIEIN